jgi:hypothetical protein
MVQNLPLTHIHLFKSESPKIQQFGPNPKSIRRDLARSPCRKFYLTAISRLRKAHGRLINPDDRDILELSGQMERTFASTAARIQDKFTRVTDKFAHALKRLAGMVRDRAQKSRGGILAHHGF